jgi:hypothetical protein
MEFRNTDDRGRILQLTEAEAREFFAILYDAHRIIEKTDEPNRAAVNDYRPALGWSNFLPKAKLRQSSKVFKPNQDAERRADLVSKIIDAKLDPRPMKSLQATGQCCWPFYGKKSNGRREN